MFCDRCAAEPAPFDHLDLSGAEPVFQRLCRRCGDAEKALWDAARPESPGTAPGLCYNQTLPEP